MKMIWRNKVIDVRDCKVIPGQISEGDFINYGLQYVRVTCIQRDCPRLENLSAVFTMFTCEREDGTLVPIRDLQGKQVVLKRNKVKVVMS